MSTVISIIIVVALLRFLIEVASKLFKLSLPIVITSLKVFVIFIVACLLIGIVYEIIFWVTHRRPLNDTEIALLSNGRKNHYINSTFGLANDKFSISPSYRESLNHDGRWDKISISYKKIPAFIAELLRYKRHEWSVWVLTDENTAKYVWANKGNDNESCYSKTSTFTVIQLAKAYNCNTIVHFHNHPHTKERYWNLLAPSDVDVKTGENLKSTFNAIGLNFIDGIASQGKCSIYLYGFSDKYIPDTSSLEKLNAENGVSKKANYRLHKELRRLKNEQISNKLFPDLK